MVPPEYRSKARQPFNVRLAQLIVGLQAFQEFEKRVLHTAGYRCVCRPKAGLADINTEFSSV